MTTRHADSVAVLCACAVFACYGWLIGRMMLRREQRREREVNGIYTRLGEVEIALDKIHHPEHYAPPPPIEPEKAAKK